MSTTTSRRLEVLRLSREYNFLILEDDPYYHIYYGSSPRPPSYFSLERSTGGEIGRVLRFDSFSKILSSGFRIGWITGPQILVDTVDRHVNHPDFWSVFSTNPSCTERVLHHATTFDITNNAS